MLKAIARKGIESFEKQWGYDASYLHEILDEGGLDAVMAVNGVTKLGAYCKDVPLDAYYAAKLLSVREADCGPCTQLIVDMAQRAGVAEPVLRAVLERNPHALPPDAKLAYEFAEATLAHDFAADALREQIVARWGKRALISIAYGIVAAQIYPTLKYALGHGHACLRVRVADADVAVPARA